MVDERDASALAAGEDVDGFEDVVVLEAERAGEVAERALVRGRGVLLELFEDGALGAEAVHHVLGVVAHRDRGADRGGAGVGREVAADHLE